MKLTRVRNSLSKLLGLSYGHKDGSIYATYIREVKYVSLDGQLGDGLRMVRDLQEVRDRVWWSLYEIHKS